MRTLLGAVLIFTAVPALGFDFCEAEGPRCRLAADAELAALRGGFDVHTPGGRLRIDIGIVRGVAVNDRVVALSAASGPLIVQIGPGNLAPAASAFHGGALPTIVQNTLDNQTLKTFTIVNASVNSLSILNSLRLGEMMARATRASGR
jgi:hypothetical protein